MTAMQSGTVTLHRADVVFPVTAPPIVDGAVAVRRGRILAVGGHDELGERLRDLAPIERRRWRGALIPGLVNAHTHLQYTAIAEVGRGSYTSFEDWSRSFLMAYQAADHDWRAASAHGAELALRAGTTAVAEIVTDPEAARALHEAGLHGVAYWEVLAFTSARQRAEGPRLVEEGLAGIPSPPHAGISPHAIYSLDTEVLRDLTALARERGLRQHIHAAEAASENEYALAGTGPLAEQWRRNGHAEFALLAEGGSGHRAIGYLDAVGALTPQTHLAHGIYVDADDRALLRAREVAVALCPRSNAVIGLDPPPVADYLREGSPIAVGTDSLSSSPSLGPLADVAALYRLARAQGYSGDDLHARLLRAATVGGAFALGLVAGADAAGQLREGHRADLAVFEVASGDPRDALAELVEEAPAEAAATIVAGETRWTPRGLEGVLSAEGTGIPAAR